MKRSQSRRNTLPPSQPQNDSIHNNNFYALMQYISTTSTISSLSDKKLILYQPTKNNILTSTSMPPTTFPTFLTFPEE
ncbi:hypothetical protein Glove_228g118 [Diversispora epigaea]|uniref:Uncharacterized protein n=1 Tax=Diversispora epigaea TaxID=1348612 RepID=A0A397IDV6_9GLOM|nr:hypothetical protein Glove_228g118 [Diversispora epigaea]